MQAFVRRDLRLQATVNALETLGGWAAEEGKLAGARELYQNALTCG